MGRKVRADLRKHWMGCVWCLTVALAACATTEPVWIADFDLAAINRLLNASDPSGEKSSHRHFQVEELFLDGRDATLRLRANEDHDGWRRSAAALCRRSRDDAPWKCGPSTESIFAILPDGGFARAIGMSGPLAAKAVRLAATAPAAAQLNPAAIECLVRREPGSIVVQYAGPYSHAGPSQGFVHLESSGGRLSVERVIPPPDWFHGSEAGLWECMMGDVLISPASD